MFEVAVPAVMLHMTNFSYPWAADLTAHAYMFQDDIRNIIRY